MSDQRSNAEYENVPASPEDAENQEFRRLQAENQELREVIKHLHKQATRTGRLVDRQQRQARRQRVLGLMEGVLTTLNGQAGFAGDPLNAPQPPRQPSGVVGLLNVIVSYLRAEADADMLDAQFDFQGGEDDSGIVAFS